MVIPTAHGSVLIGPDAEDLEDKTDRSTTGAGLDDVVDRCRVLMPDIDTKFAIKTFAGLRPHSDKTYRVGWSETAGNLLQAAGIRSTGVSSSLAMGDHIRDLLVGRGSSDRLDAGARNDLEYTPPLWADGDYARVGKQDPLGRTVVCHGACEKVTAADIHQTLRSRCRRHPSGSGQTDPCDVGRCQGSACLSGVSFITSLYTPGGVGKRRCMSQDQRLARGDDR